MLISLGVLSAAACAAGVVSVAAGRAGEAGAAAAWGGATGLVFVALAMLVLAVLRRREMRAVAETIRGRGLRGTEAEVTVELERRDRAKATRRPGWFAIAAYIVGITLLIVLVLALEEVIKGLVREGVCFYFLYLQN
jgi:hypothetical protein